MYQFTVTSWNVRGIRSQAKKIKIFDYVSRLNADIVFFQETHLLKSEEKSLTDSNFNKIYNSCFNSRQRGVSVLLNKRLPVNIINSVIDPEGRYIIIKVVIYNKCFTILNLYAPNNDDPDFFHRIFSELSDLSADSSLIIGGDFNLALNTSLDRSSKCSNTKPSRSAKVLMDYMEDLGIGDVWRLNNPTKKEYTFFSPVHKSFSRIDFFLSNNSIVHKMSSKIHPIIISDHAPISLTLQCDSNQKVSSLWRFNTSLLNDSKFEKIIRKEWEDFLLTNDSPEISPSLLWETGKAVIRGKIISYSSFKKKQEQMAEKTLEEKIKKLTEEYAANPSELLWEKLQNTKLNLNIILSKKTDFILQQLRYKNFDYNNKSGKYLANQLKHSKENSFIAAISDNAGQTLNLPQDINNIFHDYYQNLYSSNLNPDPEDIKTFLNKLNLPQLTIDQKTTLDSPLTLQELQNALDSMSTGKAPGPDGFPAEFLKHFWSMLAPLFFRVVTEIKNKGHVGGHMNTANIKLLLKPDKNPILPSSYRPISLINTDLKIISKALTSRLEKVVQSIIHQDQTGFIKNRHSTDNVRRLFNVINMAQNSKKKTIILSLDAEKAFDRVNWSFLLTVLGKFGFGESFIQWISTLYNKPKASVTTNKITSQSFTLQRGTRQGCPLSPLLFAIFVEPLAAAVRQNSVIKGIHSSISEHKINLYADDILLYLEEPQSSLEEVFNLINSFSKLSDYSINWTKSSILPLTKNSWNPAHQNPQHPSTTNTIKYLGLNISPNLNELIKLNHDPMLDKVTEDLRRWNNLPISLLGRIASVKMKILPKINYLFSMIPLKPPKQWFQRLDSTTTKFYTRNKKPKISLSTLQKNKDEGGLEAPNFMHYYLANQILYLTEWLNPKEYYNTWLEIEQLDCKHIKLSDLPFITATLKHHNCFKNPLIASTLIAWWKALDITNGQLKTSILSPIWHNPDFKNKKTPLYLKTWEESGITHLQDLFENDKIRSYNNLTQAFDINKSNFLQYLQVTETIKKTTPLDLTTLQPPELAIYMKKISTKSKKLSKIYRALSNTNCNYLPIAKWEAELSITPSTDFWAEICCNTFKMTKNTNLQLIQYKVLHRSHITQQKMHKMGFSATDICSQCTQNTADSYLHALWLCSP
uniref:Reverse transcriptase domain-containing protein n=1 Tax=Gouania willdenowi TaxID=441366 RepID=A0A8C5HQA3_GOUWI